MYALIPYLTFYSYQEYMYVKERKKNMEIETGEEVVPKYCYPSLGDTILDCVFATLKWAIQAVAGHAASLHKSAETRLMVCCRMWFRKRLQIPYVKFSHNF
jgi:hypothetical protein